VNAAIQALLTATRFGAEFTAQHAD
jgi:hypothetical protein